MPSNRRTLEEMDRRVEELISGFERYMGVFASAKLFSGPSVHFHERTRGILRQCGGVAEALHRDDFLECLYATLASWGMHRMGPGNTKLIAFDEFTAELRGHRDEIAALEWIDLAKVSCTPDNPQAKQFFVGTFVTPEVWKVMRSLRLSPAKACTVLTSKTLHHLVPGAVPPMDREYTFRFFYGRDLSIPEAEAFEEMHPRFARILASTGDVVSRRLAQGQHPMDTSATKLLDNAIVGYVLVHSKRADTAESARHLGE